MVLCRSHSGYLRGKLVVLGPEIESSWYDDREEFDPENDTDEELDQPVQMTQRPVLNQTGCYLLSSLSLPSLGLSRQKCLCLCLCLCFCLLLSMVLPMVPLPPRLCTLQKTARLVPLAPV